MLNLFKEISLASEVILAAGFALSIYIVIQFFQVIHVTI